MKESARKINGKAACAALINCIILSVARFILTPSPSSSGRERGSILFYIFIGIAVFAALSFAVANIMRSGGGNPKREIASLYATDIQQYAEGLRRAVQALRIQGIEDTAMSFENPIADDYDHAGCTDDSCRVFANAGGGMAYAAPSAEWLDSEHAGQPYFGAWYFPAKVCVEGAGNGGSGCESDSIENEDLVALLPWVTRDLCLVINENLGISNPGDEPPQANSDTWPADSAKFLGSYAAENSVINMGGETSGCYRGTAGTGRPGSEGYVYFKVLLGR